MTNISDADFDQLRDWEGFSCRRAYVGRQAGARRLGISLWEVPAGQTAYPYHFHLAEEEALLVLDGAPSLRTPEGWRELAAGDLVAFPAGEEGGHQISNRSDATVRFLAISTSGEPDIVLYPDSGKVGASERRPDGGGLWTMHRLADAVDYMDGERPPQ